jgi:hypothetical protein
MVRRRRKSLCCEITPVIRRGVEMLYVVYFLVPRFLNLPFREKLVTIFHELYHISPEFNGDIRRFPGKNYAHGSSRKKFNKQMDEFVNSYLEKTADSSLAGFLEGDMAAIRARHGSIVGRRMAAPRFRIVNQDPVATTGGKGKGGAGPRP